MQNSQHINIILSKGKKKKFRPILQVSFHHLLITA